MTGRKLSSSPNAFFSILRFVVAFGRKSRHLLMMVMQPQRASTSTNYSQHWLHSSTTSSTLLNNILTRFSTGGKGGKGLGKGGAKRHRKILRDNIQGITKPAIRRLARRGGVKRISASQTLRVLLIQSILTRRSDLRGDSWCSEDLPWGCYSWRCHLHWAREEKDCYLPRCCLCSQAPRPYSLRFRWLSDHTFNTSSGDTQYLFDLTIRLHFDHWCRCAYGTFDSLWTV